MDGGAVEKSMANSASAKKLAMSFGGGLENLGGGQGEAQRRTFRPSGK